MNDERSIVRSWLMRGTLHVVAAEDLRWLVQLLGPVFARADAPRQIQLGLDDDLKKRGIAAIRRVLMNAGPLTRHELVDRLRHYDIVLDLKTQAPIHLIRAAALQSILCLGPERDDGQPTHVLIDDWIAPAPTPSRNLALTELARRYFAAFGPATIEDFVSWSGLSTAEARSGAKEAKASLAEVMIQAGPALVPSGWLSRESNHAAPHVRLLPAFDTYLLGYRRRDLTVPLSLQRRLQRGGGWLHPAVVINGRAVGAWSLRKSGRQGHLLVEPVEAINGTLAIGIARESRDIGRFLDLQVSVHSGVPTS